MSELKKELCNELIEKNLVEEGDMIYHSYTNNRLSGTRDINTTQNKDTECQSANEGFNPWYKSGLRIRKLTPKECVRLMGFSDQDYMAMKQVNSDSQIYKQCGNSIVVNVLEAIFKEMM